MAEITFGEWLQRERKLLRLTQAQLAEQIGCSTVALRKIEAEERRPSAQICDRLADILAIPTTDRATFLRFARGDWQAAPASVLTGPALRVERPAPKSRLPALLTSFIGRERDVAAVLEYLANPTTRLVTLIGPPGIGKTRLSLQVATEAQQNFADGVFFVPLAPIADANLVAPEMVQALGLVQTDQRSTLERLKDGIADRHLLIVLDNFEQIAEGAAPLIPELLMACPRLKLLVTSRESLRVPGEWLYAVPPLLTPDDAQLKTLNPDAVDQFSALRLFAERARAVRADFALTQENMPAVTAICRRLDSLPLAIELIAARIRLMSPQVLLSRVTSDFLLHADGMRGVPPRQKTLHDAIAWSYSLLSPDERALLIRLSVFAGSFTLEAAQAITQMPDVIAGLTSLIDKSLVVRTVDVKGEARFSLLMMIRDFALARLCEMNEEAALRDRHAGYFLDLAEQADKESHGPNQVELLDRLEIEHDNFRAALDWNISSHQMEPSLKLFGALGWFRRLRGFWDETRTGFDTMRLESSVVNYPEAYAKALNAMGRIAWIQGDYRYAQVLLNESCGIWRTLGADGERGLAEALLFLGMVARWREGNDNTAQSFLEESFDLYQACEDRWGMAFVMLNLGIVASDRDHDVSALYLFEQSRDFFSRLGDLWGVGRASQHLGEIYLKQENYAKARLYFEQHLKMDEGLHFRQGVAVALGNLGNLYRHQGDYERAKQFYETSLLLCREYGLKNDLAYDLYSLGLVALHRNDYRLARQHFTSSFDLARMIYDEKMSACDLINGLAAVTAGMNQPERAAELYGAAQAIFETIDYRIPPFDRAELDRHIQIAREQLGAEAFDAIAAEGHAMTLKQAVEHAISYQTT